MPMKVSLTSGEQVMSRSSEVLEVRQEVTKIRVCP